MPGSNSWSASSRCRPWSFFSMNLLSGVLVFLLGKGTNNCLRGCAIVRWNTWVYNRWPTDTLQLRLKATRSLFPRNNALSPINIQESLIPKSIRKRCDFVCCLSPFWNWHLIPLYFPPLETNIWWIFSSVSWTFQDYSISLKVPFLKFRNISLNHDLIQMNWV